VALWSRLGPPPAAGPDPTVTVEGLADLRKRLRKYDKEIDKEARLVLRAPLVKARGRARQRASRYSKTGALERSIGLSLTQKQVALVARVPYAAAQEWGTSGKPTSRVKPKGTPIKIPRRENLWGAAMEYRSTMVRAVQDMAEEVAKKTSLDK
jgi:phage gpG-like protein